MSKRWRRIVLISFLMLVLAFVGLIALGNRRPRFSNSISFLQGKKGERHSSMMGGDIFALSIPSRGPVSRLSPTQVIREDELFVFDQPFEEIDATTKPIFKPMCYEAAAFPTDKRTLTMYWILDPKTKNSVMVTVRALDKGRSAIAIEEYREATWIDRTLNWFKTLFKSKDQRNELHY